MNVQDRIRRITLRLERLDVEGLEAVERAVAAIEASATRELLNEKLANSCPSQWPHAPTHCLGEGKGTFIVTAGTHEKAHHFSSPARMDYLQNELLLKAKEYQWQLDAWSVFSNHYHFVGHALVNAKSLHPFLTHLHADTAREINRLDGVSDRQVWFNFWETELTFEKSYLARLNYVHQNAVKHRLVAMASQYRWCSAAWFERTATSAQVKTIYGFKTDKVKVRDDYDVLKIE
jgi:putative transposase